jgi:hypothetical protein
VAPRILKNSISFLATIIFVFLFAGGAFGDDINSVKITKDNEREFGQIKERYKHQNGPPAHAPTYGLRAKYQYRYYPRCRVYYYVEKGVYFYLKGKNWEVAISLPDHLKNDLGEYVSLELDTDKPYLFNKEHIKKYSSVKRKMNFFTKLWILMFAR